MKHGHKPIIVAIIGLALLAGVVFSSYGLSRASDVMTVAFLDVGQGDAIFIETPSGRQMLIDAGKNALVLDELGKFMSFSDRSLDIVMATHPDTDHIGGLPEVFDRFDISYYIAPDISGDSNAFEALMERVSLEGARSIEAKRGTTLVLDRRHGIYFQILAPDESFAFANTNEMSIVGRLVFGESEFLLTGDAGKAVETLLVYADGKLLESDVLKVGHHGSRTSSGGLFLGAVQPTHAVISAGYNNSYGHPHDEVAGALEDHGAAILETAKEGSIVFQTDGQELWVK